jgi:hypothetical protein
MIITKPNSNGIAELLIHVIAEITSFDKPKPPARKVIPILITKLTTIMTRLLTALPRQEPDGFLDKRVSTFGSV